MQVTHQEARLLIQFHADEALNAQEKTVLLTHLKACLECRAYAHTYAAETKDLEDTLLPAMRRQWNLQPIPLSISDLQVNRNTRASSSTTLAIRTAVIAFVFVAFVFITWEFTRPGPQLLGLPPVIVAPVSTPSLESTNTSVGSEQCERILYTVQANDTLSGIAAQFSISKDQIITLNDLKTETIHAGMPLILPVCNFTPTSTLSPTNTTTNTPVIGSATQPGGY